MLELLLNLMNIYACYVYVYVYIYNVYTYIHIHKNLSENQKEKGREFERNCYINPVKYANINIRGKKWKLLQKEKLKFFFKFYF